MVYIAISCLFLEQLYTVYWKLFAKENVRGFRESRYIRDNFLGII